MNRWWVHFSLGLILILGTGRLLLLELRLAQLEERPQSDPRAVRELRGELGRVRRELESSGVTLAELRHEADVARSLDVELDALRSEFQTAAVALEDQECRLELWEAMRPEMGPRALDQRVETLRAVIEQRWGDVQALAASAAGLARSNNEQLVELETVLDRDVERMWRTLVGPVVQLAGESTVGSGVLLQSNPHPTAEDVYVTWLLTAWHVVRDIQSDARSVDALVPVAVYSQDARIRQVEAQLIVFDANIDVALLRIETETPLECGASLMPRTGIANVHVFEPVYAVGCPLGNDPIPTYGEIAATRHLVDGERYWMISAPTYVGNSGGGIFDARTHQLLGIFSKIYTHGTLRPTVVPHMGLVTPLDEIYDWMHSVGHGDLEPVADLRRAETASMSR